mgnify:CR=1 FL=1
MHDIWLTAPQQRLKKWRDFRKQLLVKNKDAAIKECIDLWTSAPISSRFLDIHDKSTWLKPWDLVWSGDFDEDSITLGLAYTLFLGGYEETEILVVVDNERSFEKLIIVIDNDIVLRYSHIDVKTTEILNTVEIKDRIKIKDII